MTRKPERRAKNTDDAERLKAVLDLASGWPTLDALSTLAAAIANVIHRAANGDILTADRLIDRLTSEMKKGPRRGRDVSRTKLH